MSEENTESTEPAAEQPQAEDSPAAETVSAEAAPARRHVHMAPGSQLGRTGRVHYPDDPDPKKWVVTFKDVVKRFPTESGFFTAVKDVNFKVYDIPDVPEFISLLGPSGCGKSTILNMIAGFYGPTEGEVLVFGEKVKQPGADRGMVFQTYSSFPHLTVWENVAFGYMIHELQREKNPFLSVLDSLIGIRGARRRRMKEMAMEWVERVGLKGSEEKFPHQLSGGMRQRVAIARTLTLKPRIILMDEPFGALDRVTRWEMQDLLIRIWNDVEATVFLITHDIGEAVYLSDRIYILSDSPGTINEEIAVPHADKPAAETQSTTEFSELVNEISAKVEKTYLEAKLNAAK